MDGCRVGVGRAEITPVESAPTMGWGPLGRKRPTPPTEPMDRSFVTALALEDPGGYRVTPEEYREQLRRGVDDLRS